MREVRAGYKIIDKLDGKVILEKIERIARVCYKSEDKIREGSAEKLISALIKNGHEAMLEHYSFSVLFTVDRGVSHEIVRHRIASFAQESTRYCNYGDDEGGISVIRPFMIANKPDVLKEWAEAVERAEKAYNDMLKNGCTPQEARAVLPNSLKTEIVMTANLREWRHFFKLRAVGETGKPHPQMVEVALPLLREVQSKIPVIFDDIGVRNE